MKILIVEDEKQLTDSISKYLRQEGFLCEIASNYSQGEDKIAGSEYDCVVIDIGLPDGNGLDLINNLKTNKSKDGILILSAHDSLDDKLKGLGLGADDYLTKPFHLSELNARIKSIIRRRNFSGTMDIIFNEIRVNTDEQQVYINENPVTLTHKEYEMLIYFLANKNRILTKESIVEHLWGDDVMFADSYEFVYTHIKNLRRKIMEKSGTDYIKTIYGLGYKLSDQ